MFQLAGRSRLVSITCPEQGQEQNTTGVERRAVTYSSHGVDRRLAQFMAQVVSLDQPDAMFAGDGPFHLDRPLDHPVHDVFGRLSLGLVEEEDCCI